MIYQKTVRIFIYFKESEGKSKDIEISDITKIDKSIRKNIPKIQVILEKILKKKYRLWYKKIVRQILYI